MQQELILQKQLLRVVQKQLHLKRVPLEVHLVKNR
jgi:hypothetical protein